MSRRIVDGKLPVPSPKANKGGVKSLLELNDELESKILSALRLGTSVGTAGAFNGISYETLRQWVLKGMEKPESRYGAFIANVKKAIAEYELRDLSVIDAHVQGRPAQYLMEPARDENGAVIWEEAPRKAKGKDPGFVGKPLMVTARDGDGRPILKASEIKSDWRAAMERMSRRLPRYWARRDENFDADGILTPDNKKADSKEALSFEQKVKQARDQLEDDV